MKVPSQSASASVQGDASSESVDITCVSAHPLLDLSLCPIKYNYKVLSKVDYFRKYFLEDLRSKVISFVVLSKVSIYE